MLCHPALRIVDPPMLRGCSAYPSIAVISISLPDRREGPMHKTRHCVAFRVYAGSRSRSITGSGIPGAHCLRLWRALAESNDRNLSRLLSREAGARTVSGYGRDGSNSAICKPRLDRQRHRVRDLNFCAGPWCEQLPIAINVAIPIQTSSKAGALELSNVKFDVTVREPRRQ